MIHASELFPKSIQKLIRLTILCLLITFKLFAQGKYKADVNQLNRATKLTQIPEITVADNSGRKYKLPDYIRQNQLHKEKPYVIVGYSNYARYYIDFLADWSSSNLGSSYNVIVLSIGGDDDMITKSITTKGFEKDWKNFLAIKTTWEDINRKCFFDSWPFLIFADKNQQIITSTGNTGAYYKSTKEILEGIHTGKIVPGKLWYTKEGVLTYQENADAVFFEEFIQQGNNITRNVGNRQRTLSRRNYINKGDAYYYDGIIEDIDENGVVLLSGSFKEGAVATTVTQKNREGKIEIIIPPNGIAKWYDDKGNIKCDGPMVNGLGNGLFVYYENGIKTAEHNYKNGELSDK